MVDQLGEHVVNMAATVVLDNLVRFNLDSDDLVVLAAQWTLSSSWMSITFVLPSVLQQFPVVAAQSCLSLLSSGPSSPHTLKNFTWATVMGHYVCGLLARETIVLTNANLQV